MKESSWVLKRLRRPRFLLVYPLAACLFLLGHITEGALRAGIALIVLGEAVRVWANGYIGQSKVNEGGAGRLITAGPYAFVRHPLYLGTFLIGAGFSFAIGNLWLGLAASLCFMAVYRSKISEEEATLKQECGPEHSLYRASVPVLLPAWFRYGRRSGRWTWGGILASKEWRTVSWLIIVIILLYVWEEAVQERELFFARRSAFRVSLLVLVLMIAAVDGAVHVAQSRLGNGPAAPARS